jgi:hypothetical protein
VEIADSFRVGVVSYRSPLEVVLWGIATGVTGGFSFGVYKVATKALSIWDRFNESRMVHSDANLHIEQNRLESEIVAYKRMQLQRQATALFTEELMTDVEPGVLDSGTDIEEAAADALAALDDLQIQQLPAQ